jgi:hypothetical protein
MGKQRKMSWVDVPHPLHLVEFSRRMLLGFYSKDLRAQETAAVGIMEGQDTIQACCHFLQQYCTIVIDGLRASPVALPKPFPKGIWGAPDKKLFPTARPKDPFCPARSNTVPGVEGTPRQYPSYGA